MTVKLSSLRVDPKRANDGDWVDAADIGEGVAFKVRSIHYKPYDIARQHAMGRLLRQQKGKPVADDDRLAVIGPLLAEHILLDWRGFEVQYSPDTAMEVLSDLGYRTIINRVHFSAMEVGEAEAQTVEDAAKN